MRMPKAQLLLIIAAVAILAQAGDVEAGSRKKHRVRSHGGEHYDNVMANYTRRCSDLGSQFRRAAEVRPPSEQLAQATAVYQRGVTLCDGGARLQGIDDLTAAIRMIGAIPRVSL